MTANNTLILQPALAARLVHSGKVSTALMPAGEGPVAFLQALLQQFQSEVPAFPKGVSTVGLFAESSVDGHSPDATGKFLPDTDALMDQLEKQGLTPDQLAQFLAQLVSQPPQPEADVAPVAEKADPALAPVAMAALAGASATQQQVAENSDASGSHAFASMAAAVAADLHRTQGAPAATVKPVTKAEATDLKGNGVNPNAELFTGMSIDAAETDADHPGFSSSVEKANVGASSMPTDADKALAELKGIPEITATQRPPIATSTQGFIPPMDRSVGQAGWSHDLGERIVWMTDQGLQTAELRLEPRHLGPLEVRIDLHQDQASIQFASHHAAVREAIESAIPKLREMLGAQQLNLTEVNVSQQSFAEQRDNRDAQFAFDQSRPGRQGFTGQVAEGAAAYPESESSPRQAGKGLLSLYA